MAIFAFMIAIFVFMMVIFASMMAIFTSMTAIFDFMAAIQFKVGAAYIVVDQLSMLKAHFNVTYSFRGAYAGE